MGQAVYQFMAQIMTIKRLKAVFRRYNINRVGGDAAGVSNPGSVYRFTHFFNQVFDKFSLAPISVCIGLSRS